MESGEERWRSGEVQSETLRKDWEFFHEDSLRDEEELRYSTELFLYGMWFML